MLGSETDFSWEDITAAEQISPVPRKIVSDHRITYVSRQDLGPLQGAPGRPKISDFDTAVRVTSPGQMFMHPIQVNDFRAPEVTLGVPWSYKVDIWSLGIMVQYRYPVSS